MGSADTIYQTSPPLSPSPVASSIAPIKLKAGPLPFQYHRSFHGDIFPEHLTGDKIVGTLTESLRPIDMSKKNELEFKHKKRKIKEG